MAVELPDVVDIGIIKLKPNEMFYYAAWGVRYRFAPEAAWKTSEMVFNRKSDAENWMRDEFTRGLEIFAEVVPIKRTLLMNEDGLVQRWVEQLTEEN